MNALTLLKQDHGNVEGLFKQFEAAEDRAYAAKGDLRDKIVEQLSVHAGIEELVLYPAIRTEVPDVEQDVLEALEEHHAAKMLLTEIEKIDPQHERFDAKMTVLIENVRHHVNEEEDQLFPVVRKTFTTARLNELGERLEEARATAPTRPHPFQPDTPPLNAILSVPVAVVDRAITTGKELVAGLLKRAG
jgi:hemerythrin-like domain-containing protein